MKKEISHSKHKKERRSRAVTNQGEGEKRRRLKWPTGCQVTQKGVRKADEVAERAAKRREERNLRQYHKRKCTTGSSPLHSPPKPVQRRSGWTNRLSKAQEDPQLESVEGRCSSENRCPRQERGRQLQDGQLRHDEK